MGCCSSSAEHKTSVAYMDQIRKKRQGNNLLILGIKIHSSDCTVCLSGEAAQNAALLYALEVVLKKTNSRAARASEKMWDVAWPKAKITSPHHESSWRQAFFPRGRHVVGLLDALAGHGWVPVAAPNFGGPIGETMSSWPVMVCENDQAVLYTKETLFLAVKDFTYPGKLCACGPADVIESLKGNFAARLRDSFPAIGVGFDSSDTSEDWDVVWTGTLITSGPKASSQEKTWSYFPKGDVVLAIVAEIYRLGWRLVCAPNFGGRQGNWPCFIFKRLVSQPAETPAIVVAAVKDRDSPGRLCLSGTHSNPSGIAQGLCSALKKVKGNESVVLSEDGSDSDWEYVLCNASITTGVAPCAWQQSYFPRGASVQAILSTMAGTGWKLAACPNFEGDGDTWPTFIWEFSGQVMKSAFVAIKDESTPVKYCLSGVEQTFEISLLAALHDPKKSMSQGNEEDFDMAIENTKLTAGGWGTCWPHGFPLEILLGELFQSGWIPAAGPTFGSMHQLCPALVLQKNS